MCAPPPPHRRPCLFFMLSTFVPLESNYAVVLSCPQLWAAFIDSMEFPQYNVDIALYTALICTSAASEHTHTPLSRQQHAKVKVFNLIFPSPCDTAVGEGSLSLFMQPFN